MNCGDIQNSILKLVNAKDKTFSEIKYMDNLRENLAKCYEKL